LQPIELGFFRDIFSSNLSSHPQNGTTTVDYSTYAAALPLGDDSNLDFPGCNDLLPDFDMDTQAIINELHDFNTEIQSSTQAATDTIHLPPVNDIPRANDPINSGTQHETPRRQTLDTGENNISLRVIQLFWLKGLHQRSYVKNISQGGVNLRLNT